MRNSGSHRHRHRVAQAMAKAMVHAAVWHRRWCDASNGVARRRWTRQCYRRWCATGGGAAVSKHTSDFRIEAGDDLAVMTKAFVITMERTDYLLVTELYRILMALKVPKKKGRDRLERMGAWRDGNCCVNGVRHGSGFMGLRVVQLMLEGEEAA